MRLGNTSASLACASALLGVEALGVAGFLSDALVLPARWMLALFFWIQCWSGLDGGAGDRSRVLPGQGQGGASLVPERAAGCAQSKTWRSAGAQLPSPEMAMNLIKSRRSVFCKDLAPGRRIPRGTLSLLLEAANWAPSHGRTDPWRFVVFDTAEGRQDLAELSVNLIRRHQGEDAARVAAQEFEPGKRWANASCLIAICVRRRPRCCRPGLQPMFNPEWEEVAAVACAVQNLHLMATALPGVCGYWSSWYGCVRDSPELHSLLSLSQGDRCLGFFVLGHCDTVGEFRAARPPVAVEWR